METRTTLRSLSETLLTTALPSLALYLVPSTYIAPTRYTCMVTTDCKFPDILLREASTLRMRIPSIICVSSIPTPQDAHKRIVLQVYHGLNALEFSAIYR